MRLRYMIEFSMIGVDPDQLVLPYPVGVWIQGPNPVIDFGLAFLPAYDYARERAVEVIEQVYGNDPDPPDDLLEQCRELLVPIIKVKSKIQGTDDYDSVEDCADALMHSIAAWRPPPEINDDESH